LVTDLLPDHLQAYSVELAPYLVNCDGNYQRIDYGSGHEASFMILLYCLDRLGLVRRQQPESSSSSSSTDLEAALVLVVFNRYLQLMRKVQRQYLLEPAGSHGVWGLDDYQFLPFYFGAGQLIDHPRIRPKSILQTDIIEAYRADYMYLAAVHFILQMKKGPFGEHSPILYDIAHVPHQLWLKLNNGMLKMYEDEVLRKFPVIQHVLFGGLFPFE
jgi:serine/threonine-protein phosphatase 2A activator